MLLFRFISRYLKAKGFAAQLTPELAQEIRDSSADLNGEENELNKFGDYVLSMYGVLTVIPHDEFFEYFEFFGPEMVGMMTPCIQIKKF